MNKILIIFLFFVSTFCIAQQDIQTSQYMFNFSAINPAYVGSRELLEVDLSSRNQWVSFEGAPVSQTFSMHAPLTKYKIGVGFMLTNDIIGPRKVLGLNSAYSYKIRLGYGKLRFGLRAGFYSYTYDWDILNYENKEDQIIQQGVVTKLVPNFDFGTYYHDKSNYIGVELAHLNSNKIYKNETNYANSGRLYPSLSAFYGRAFQLANEAVLKSSILIRKTENAPGYAEFNTSFFLYRRLWLGASYRTSKAIVLICEYSITKNLRFGYSYDLTLSNLSNFQSGSHEIFLGYDVNIFKHKDLSPRYF